jgi:hypothetical protein
MSASLPSKGKQSCCISQRAHLCTQACLAAFLTAAVDMHGPCLILLKAKAHQQADDWTVLADLASKKLVNVCFVVCSGSTSRSPEVRVIP